MFGDGNPDKEAWFEEAKRAYEEFLGRRAQRGTGLGTFSELEAQAEEAGDRLARFLIERVISAESAKSAHPEECDCPRCGKPAKRKDPELERRDLRAKPGEVSYERPGYYCVSCRKVFFSARPRTRSES